MARRPFITDYIEVEAHALLLRKLGRMLAREWLLTGGLPVVRALPAEEERAGKSLRDIQTRTGVFATPFPSPFWRLVGFVARLRSIATSDSSAGSKSWGWVGDVASVTLTKVGITLMD